MDQMIFVVLLIGIVLLGGLAGDLYHAYGWKELRLGKGPPSDARTDSVN